MQIDYEQIQKLVESNSEVRVSEFQKNSSQKKISTIGSSYLPDVFLYARSEKQKMSELSKELSYGVVANFNLFNGMRDLEQRKINIAAYKVSSFEASKVYKLKILQARIHYFNILKNFENLKILSEYELINRNNRSLILKKVSSGLSPKSEEMIFKKIELELKELKIKEENEQKLNMLELKSILSLSANEKIDVVGKMDVANFEYKIGNNRIQNLIAQANEEQVMSEKKLTGLWRMPKVDFFVEKSFSRNVNGEYLEAGGEKNIFGIHVTMPLLDEKNEISIADQIKRTELISTQLKLKQQLIDSELNEIKLNDSISYLKLMIEISKAKVSLLKEIMDRTYSEFKIGLKDADSLNDSTKDYLEARKDLVDHQHEYIINVETANAANI